MNYYKPVVVGENATTGIGLIMLLLTSGGDLSCGNLSIRFCRINEKQVVVQILQYGVGVEPRTSVWKKQQVKAETYDFGQKKIEKGESLV